MKTLFAATAIVLCWIATVPAANAQKHELGLTLGGVLGGDRTSISGITFDESVGVALQANYGHRVLEREKASLYLCVHFLANPSRKLNSANTSLPNDYATLYVTPGILVKLYPRGRVQPWGTIAGGYALYEATATLLNGQPNTGDRFVHRGAFMYGGGADFVVFPWVAVRAEIRDFYTGRPSVNTPLPGGQHNVVVGGGVVLRFGK